MKPAITISVLACWFCVVLVNGLPVQQRQQQQQQQQQVYSSPNAGTTEIQAYSVYSSILEYYEALVDATLSIQSEELLITLIHLPKESRNRILTSQAESMGFKTISDKQLNKMPSLIGKHIQAMNANVYASLEPIVNSYWSTLWDNKLLYASNQEEILSFLSSLNRVVAKKLIDQVDNYHLLEKIKQDMVSLYQEKPWVGWFFSTKTIVLSFGDDVTDQDSEFLRQHVADTRTSLLMELHIQFMDFFTRIQTDIAENFVIYNED
ncbi:hypothetical protein [Parasitella parasitica]|uniref:Uncharacterized protein n=1 Tax=Parasitella parasitica TaxID=35722 RepID=A0A0B7N1P0_9FUNG|nr:hypothetical protein [Parasitella parasitica]